MPRRGSLPLLVVLGLWLAAVALIGAGGEFPLSDDWAYAHVVRSLIDGHGFDFLPWTGASLVVQALYGAAACKLAGFSHQTLRVTTLVMSAIGIVSLYALLRELGAAARVAAAGAGALAFSPLWLSLSFTFMTDVPFAALAIAATWLYVRALRAGSRSGLVTAGAVAAAAFLVRQHAASVAVAAALAALVPPRADGSGAGAPLQMRLLDAAAALALPLAAAAAYTLWAVTSSGAPLAVHNKLDDLAAVSVVSMASAAFRALATLGFLLMPWTLATPLPPGRARSIFALCSATLAALAVFVLVRNGATMFYLTNVLGDFTVGALTTRDLLFLGHDVAPSGGPLFHALLTTTSLASAASLVARVAAAMSPGTTRVALFCVLALLLSGAGTLVQAHYYFDRYLLVLVPLAIASMVSLPAAPRPGPAFACALLALSLYAVAGTHDYMAWNRARWDLLSGLEQRGVSARSIDGGVEYNAERLAAVLRTAPSDAQARTGQPASARSWWWVEDDEWVIAFGDLDGYARSDSRSFTRWLPPGQGRVLELRREAAGGHSRDAATGTSTGLSRDDAAAGGVQATK